MKTSIMFLFGSGLSKEAGFPSTGNINDQVFSGINILRHTDSRYYLSNKPLDDLEKYWTSKPLQQITDLFSIIKALMLEYDKQEEIDYEILYYYIDQIHNYESGEQYNKALTPFVLTVSQRLKALHGNIRIIDVSWEALVYIRHSVWRLLNINQTKSISYLHFLSDAFRDSSVQHINISTLNHDQLLEKYLDKMKIKYFDGFGLEKNKVRYWDNKFNDSNNLLKLHGSINWFTLAPDGGSWFDYQIGSVSDWDIDHILSPTGNLMRSIPYKREPQILIGTMNKLYEYNEDIFSELHCKFRSLLKLTTRLIITGYSFGDKGINEEILEWLYSNKNNKIIVIHHNPEHLLQITSRNAIAKAYMGITKNNFVTISKNIENTSWQEIKSKL